MISCSSAASTRRTRPPRRTASTQAEYLNLSPGEHTLKVRAIDMLGQGLADPTPGRLHVDVCAAAVRRGARGHPRRRPARRDVHARGDLHLPLERARCRLPVPRGHERLPTVRLRGCDLHEPGAAFEWGFEPNEIGLHTVEVRAIDFEGNVGEPAPTRGGSSASPSSSPTAPGSRLPPVARRATPAAGGPTASTSAAIQFESNASDAQFWCRFDSLDPASYFPCESPFLAGPAHAGNTSFPDPLTVGDHMLKVFAESELMGSAAELEPAVYEWESRRASTPARPDVHRAGARLCRPELDDLRVLRRHRRPDAAVPAHLPVPGSRGTRASRTRTTGSTASARSTCWTCRVRRPAAAARGAHVLRPRDRHVRAGVPRSAEPGGGRQPRSSYTWTPVADTRAPLVTISGGPADGATVGPEAEPYTFLALPGGDEGRIAGARSSQWRAGRSARPTYSHGAPGPADRQRPRRRRIRRAGTPRPRRRWRRSRRWRARWRPTSAWSAAATPGCRRRCISPRPGSTWCCSRRRGSAGAPRGATAGRWGRGSGATRAGSSGGSGAGGRGCSGTSPRRRRRWCARWSPGTASPATCGRG